MFTWIRLQGEVTRWTDKNFPGAPVDWQVCGLVEELGELTHAHLKRLQGIRGTTEEHLAAGKDAIADSLIFFMHACSTLKWDAATVLRSETPEEFQKTFTVPPRRTPITYILKGLAGFAGAIEDRLTAPSQEAPNDVHQDNFAEASALAYVSGLAAYCSQMGWSLQDIIEEVWPKVRQRDWTKNKVDGGDLSPGQVQKDLDETRAAEPTPATSSAKVSPKGK